ncbi:MAG: sensor histidine kinase [Thermoanaerobaculia bacterium]
MARKCFMCGGEVVDGILCDKCDKPRKKPVSKASAEASQPLATTPAPQPQAPARRGDSGRHEAAAAAAALPQEDPFPKAPVVPFPVESASPAITSVVNLLVASGVPSVLIGPDRSVKYVSDDACRLFDATHVELATLAAIESRSGISVGDLTVPTSAGVRISNRNFIYTLVPMSGGASGAVLVFRHADPMNVAHASFITYVRETVFGPLHALRESMESAARSRNDHMLAEFSATVEQVLSSLELAPEVEEPALAARPVPTVTELVRRVAERFRAYADLKGIRLDIDVQDLEERFADHEQLSESLAIMMENALHYVPASGQVVIGVRWMEHKGKPLLLFFVMDNGPVVPESLRQQIFEPSFVWNPQSPDRTGRGLFKCREFAVAHAGSVWVESRTGKACTFFLRVRPDGIR